VGEPDERRREKGRSAATPLLGAIAWLFAACAAHEPFANTPPSPDRPWKAPEPVYAPSPPIAAKQAEKSEPVEIDTKKTYDLNELIDIAQRTNPETRIAWEHARQAALAAGLAEGTYYPRLAAVATAAIASVPLPIPQTVVPGGVFRADTHFAIPALDLEWLLLDFGRRRAAVDAAQALIVEANAGFNAKHQQVVFNVTRDFYALTAARGKVNADRAALDSARTLQESVVARKNRGLATQPEVLQADEEAARANYDLEDASATEHNARMTLLESVGIAPYTPIEIVDVSQQPLPPELTESVDEAIDRALAQRPDLIALLAGVQAKEATVREARASYWPRLAVQSQVGGNIGELSVEDSPYQSVADLQYGAGLRFEWDLFEGFERRNNLRLAESLQKEAEDELEHAKDKAVRQVWMAYNDAKVALAKERAAAALLAASEKAWAATSESYKHGLTTFPDVRESQRSLARARALEQAARAEAWTRAAAFAVSTGDLAKP
jgi:outer membrane protein TolC